MKRSKLNRKEKLLFATPLLLPLLVLAWPLVSVGSLDRALRELAGPEAIDCGTTSSAETFYTHPCAVAAFKAGKPFMLRWNWKEYRGGKVRTPQGQVYSMYYIHSGDWKKKSRLCRKLHKNVYLSKYPNERDERIHIDRSEDPIESEETQVWW